MVEPAAAEYMGVRVPHSPYLNETRIRRINAGRYEGEEIAGALSLVGPEDRVLELGAGLGVVGSVTLATRKARKLLAFEANPDIVPHIDALYRMNGLKERAEVRNAVLWSGPERPDAVDFFVRNSFLGSSLADQKARKTRRVSVPTEDYGDVLKDFAPTVLLIDIEGGELEFLRHADLDGVRALVIEFHPAIYGKEGMQACKSILRRAGFRPIPDRSTRLVWTAQRDPAAVAAKKNADDPTQPPDPAGGWSTSIETVPAAIVVPPSTAGLVAAAGVLHKDGTGCARAALWRKKRPLTTRPEQPEGETEHLAGKWLWGGVLWNNFAHFVTESTSRLWALGTEEAAALDGILFIPKRPRADDGLQAFQTDFLELMNCHLPVRLATNPVTVDHLIVPGQGFGLGSIIAGTEPFRAAIREDFGRYVTGEGPERLYISRSRIGASRGAVVGEDVLEAHLAKAGYEIFHPQQHPLAVQIARYKAARHVVASEGSALHLFALVARPDQRVAMIARRKSGATAAIATHIESFAGTAPLLCDALLRTWQPAASGRKRLGHGEIDFVALGRKLVEGGFISQAKDWANLAREEVSARLGGDYVETWSAKAA